MVAVVCLWAASAWARCPPREYPPVLHEPGSHIPANTPLFSGKQGVTRVERDGTSLALERVDAGDSAHIFCPAS